jgi:two-component system CheB/CheR fusion protein
LLRERMDRMIGVPKVQVFATDIDEAAIATARLGRYPATLLKGLSTERCDRFFRASQGGFVVTKEIRDLCTFSAHNLIRDPPFSRMDLVSCRNLLIYMETALQAAVIPAFHYSLLPGGILLLGGSETTARHEDLFEPLDKAARIYQRRAGRSPPLNLKLSHADMHMQYSVLEAAHVPAAKGDVTKLSEDKYTHSSPQLQPTSAKFSQPASNTDRDSRMTFKSRMKGILALISPNPGEVAQLKQELVGTQEQLQSLAEQHQTALEELRSANEELHSVNEEMQSTNEELETSKEELQSVNEELHTVNGQLSEKVSELDDTNSDLRNLFESTEIATVFLDRHLIIRNFTPAIAAVYSLIPSDAGRPLGNIVSSLDYETLSDYVAGV